MRNPASFRRTTAAVGLVTTALLSTVSIVLAPPFPGSPERLLAEIDAAGASATISAFTFTLAQLPFIAAVLGVGHLLRDRAPVLSSVGTTIAVIGAFGHSVFGGVSMVRVTMAADEANRSVHAQTLTQAESSPLAAFMAMGLLGTVVGILLLAIGLWRAGVAPRWAGPLLVAFLVVEFVGTAFSQWASLVSAVLYLVAFTGLAVTVWRTPAAAWTTPPPYSGSIEPEAALR